MTDSTARTREWDAAMRLWNEASIKNGKAQRRLQFRIEALEVENAQLREALWSIKQRHGPKSTDGIIARQALSVPERPTDAQDGAGDTLTTGDGGEGA